MFVDSSRDNFSAVAFLRARVTTPTGEVKTEVAFVFGKVLLAPIKVTTVAKLELQAAPLAARLNNNIFGQLPQMLTILSRGQTARPFFNGLTLMKRAQSWLQSVFPNF